MVDEEKENELDRKSVMEIIGRLRPSAHYIKKLLGLES